MANTHLYNLLERLVTLLRSEQRQSSHLQGLQPVHLHVLYYLSRCNQYSNTPAAVTEYLELTKGTVSQSIKLLESRGLLVKIADQQDKRQMHLNITSRAKQILKNSIPPDLFNNAIKDLSNSEVADITCALEILLQKIQLTNQTRTFGLCHSCNHLIKAQGKFTCGLTRQPLATSDTEKICKDHSETNKPL